MGDLRFLFCVCLGGMDGGVGVEKDGVGGGGGRGEYPRTLCSNIVYACSYKFLDTE